MGTFLIFFIILIIISTLLKSLFNHFTKIKRHQLPPGPLTIPFIANLLWLLLPLSKVKAFALSQREKYGPIYTLFIGSKPLIFIASHSLAHQALIVNSATFADRPSAFTTEEFLSCNQHTISSAFYGPTWLVLRRNLASNILHPSKIKSFGFSRKWVLEILINSLKSHPCTKDGIELKEHIQHAIFCLFSFMCFAEKLEEKQIHDIKDAQRRLQVSFDDFKMLNLLPTWGKFFFNKRWEKLRQLRSDQENVFVPLIRGRKARKAEKLKYDECSFPDPLTSYIDTLLDLQLPEENRKLEEREIVALCSEFFTAGTDTTSTALEWIMANLVKYPEIQEKLFTEIQEVIGSDEEVEIIKEDDLEKMPYLKAVILEGLRRHPPSHFLIPHAVTKDFVLDGFLVPKNSVLIFTVAEMGWDSKVWENPMAFKPDRFLNGDDGKVVDITGSKEIKMMPFGLGRRMCPAYSLAMLHLEFFVANLVWHFKWFGLKGSEDVDLTEKHEFTTVMKNSLKVRVSPRLFVQ